MCVTSAKFSIQSASHLAKDRPQLIRKNSSSFFDKFGKVIYREQAGVWQFVVQAELGFRLILSRCFLHHPKHAFPGQGQMKPEQLEIAQLKREVLRLKAERDILKKAAAYFAKEST